MINKTRRLNPGIAFLLIMLILATALTLTAPPMARADPGVLSATPTNDQVFIEPPDILYVTMSGTSEDSCLSWEGACDLQTAIGKLPDQIWVATGTYLPTTTGDRTISFKLESGLKIYGGFPAAGGAWEDRNWELYPTFLSGDLNGDDEENFANNAENSFHVLTATYVNRLAKLDGFIITGGNANGGSLEGTSSGAGIYNANSSLILNNITFSGNSASMRGGGMFNDESSPTLTNVTFSDNSADQGGGGMANESSSPTLTNVTFNKNVGIGMFNENNSNPTLTSVTFFGNTSGSGIYNSDSSPRLTNVIFLENSACRGGGMYNSNSSPILTHVSFIRNTAVGGGGMFNGGMFSNPTLTNVIFSENHAISGESPSCPGLEADFSIGFYGYGFGGGLGHLYSSSTLINVTFWGNTATGVGGGLYANSPQNQPNIITNSILWGNSPESSQIFHEGSTEPLISYSDIQGCGNSGSGWLTGCGMDNGGNIDADPLFVDAANDNLRLRLTSPAIDAGNNAALPSAVATDLDGNLRFVDVLAIPDTGMGAPPIVDMGAYEVQNNIFLPLMYISTP